MKNLIITILIGLFNIIAISGRTLQDSLNSYFEYYKIDYKYSNYKKYYSSPVIDISKELNIIQKNKPRPIRVKSSPSAVGISLIFGSIFEASVLTAVYFGNKEGHYPNFIRRGTVENTRFNVLGIGSTACLFTSGVITCIVNKRKPARYREKCIEYNKIYNNKLKELRIAINNEAEKEVRKKFIPCSYINTTEYLSNYIKLNPSNLDTAYSIEKREIWNYPFCKKEKVGYIRLKPGEYKFSNYSSDSSFRFDYTIQGCLTCLDGNYEITEQIYKDGKLVIFQSGYNLNKMFNSDIEFPIEYYKKEQERLAEEEQKRLEEEQERLVKEEQEKIKQEWLNTPEAKRIMQDKNQLKEKFRKLNLLEGANNTIYSEARRKLEEEEEELEEREKQSVSKWLKIKTDKKYYYDDTSSKPVRKKHESFQIKHDTEEYYYY